LSLSAAAGSPLPRSRSIQISRSDSNSSFENTALKENGASGQMPKSKGTSSSSRRLAVSVNCVSSRWHARARHRGGSE
jgi:hypothetical protein